MKPFRTNAKDRAIFARVLGLEIYDRCLMGVDYPEVFEINSKKLWWFVNDGYQWTIAKLHDLGYRVETDRVGAMILEFDPHEGWELLVDHDSPNTGEALFRAVVALGRAGDGR